MPFVCFVDERLHSASDGLESGRWKGDAVRPINVSATGRAVLSAEPDRVRFMASNKPQRSQQPTSRTPSDDNRRASAKEDASSLSKAPDSSVPVPQSADYEIQESTGRDANGAVWKALDRAGQRTVALKRIRPELAGSRELVTRIRRDVKAFAGFQHPGIVQVFELKKDDHGLFLVLEWIDGSNLAETMQATGPLEEQRVVKAIARVADALHAAHERKVTHRNIKPANIMLAPHSKLKLTDFGLVRVDVESLADSIEVTDFIPPELVASPRDVSVQSDIWSLAATLYQLLTGWSVRDFEETLILPALRDTMLCALADDPAARFSDAGRFAAALRGDRSEFESRKPETPTLLTIRPAAHADSPPAVEPTVSISRPAVAARSASATPAPSHSPTPKKTTEEAPEEIQESTQPAARRATKKKAAPSRTTRDSSESETGATAGRVTKPRGPILNPQPDGESKTASRSAETTGPAEAGSGAGRVTKPRRPILNPQPDGESKTASKPAETTGPAEAGKGAGRVTKPRRPILNPQSDGESKTSSRPAETTGLEEAGASDGRVTKPRRPILTPESAKEGSPQSDEGATTESQTSASDQSTQAQQPADGLPAGTQQPTEVSADVGSKPQGDAQQAAQEGDQTSNVSSPQLATAGQPAPSRVSLGRRGEQTSAESADASELEDEGRSRQTKKTSQTLIVGWVVGLAFVLSIVIFIHRSGTNRENENRLTTMNPGTSNTAPTASGDADDFAGHEISVGPLGQFKSIRPCLEYLKRNAHRYAGDARRQHVQLLVSGGKTYGPLVIDNSRGDYPHGIHIIAKEGARPVLSAFGDIPVQLKDLRSFRLEGFDVDASEDNVAIQVSGLVPSTRLVDLHVSGFKECGLHLNGVVADVADELVIESVRFDSASADAVGIRVSSDEDVTPTRTRLVNCRMTGPQQAGIVLHGECSFIEVRENIIDEAEVGIRFSGESADWIDVLIANTTFYKCGRAGVVFEHLPLTGGLRGTQLTFYRNLFAKGGGPEVLFEPGIDSDHFNNLISTVSGSGIRENWSDRQSSADTSAGEAEIVDYDSTPTVQRRVESVEFQSTDRDRSDFLMLKRKSPLGAVGVPRLGTRPWIGARPPSE